ncbi:TonB-dependent receptor plug domain-containing protein [Pedobacter sp. SYP-B3415]|uniref:TonB-dependent receptor plug domain-containing protein n=1 Tax=Pedobacter sp. SYP-B3415 TaxID=2496641 RepID=UPI00101D5BD5|nr:TonB-dependent receptor plug domain-containing protein [Pedobacter sp. SYP-B3415]
MRTRILYLAVSLLTLVTLGAATFIQDDPFAAILKKLEQFTASHPQEKVHLHLDKPYYAVGDDIWFKAYVVDARSGEPTMQSRILYVELINERDSLKQQLKLPMTAGIIWGDFKLTDSLSEGNYRIRAYTQLMRNAGPDFFFDKTIRIANSWTNTVFVDTRFEYGKGEGAQNRAIASFKNKAGEPYANQNVSYDVQIDYRSITKGRTKTDASGNAVIPFATPGPGGLKAGRIVSSLALEDGKRVTKVIPVLPRAAELDVQFFPEGGYLLQDLPCKVAFKVSDASGRGQAARGVVLDEQGSQISNFESNALGFGNFIINPQAGKNYKARVTFADGSEKTMNLPAAKSAGITLAVNNSDPAKITLRLYTTADAVNAGEIKLVGQSGGVVYLSQRINISKQLTNVTIKKEDLPNGILQLTLFSADNMPLAERLVFVRRADQEIALDFGSPAQTAAARQKMKFDFSASAAGKPVQGSFSVSVTNAAKVAPDPDNETNIFTSLLLSGDLPGYIEKPNAYFKDSSPATVEALDNLMLTHGWRRFVWKNIIAGVNAPLVFKPEKSMRISGVAKSYGGKPVVKGKISLLATQGGLFMSDTLTNDKGEFVFDDLVFGDSVKFVVQARTDKNRKSVDITLDQQNGQLVTKNKNTGDIEVNVNTSLAGYLTANERYIQELERSGRLQRTITLDQVNIVEKKNPARNSANLNGPGRADFVLTADKLTACATLSQCLQGRLPFVLFRNGIPYSTRTPNTPMLIVLDGMQVEGDFLDNINPNDVETIEVLRTIGNLAIYGSRGGGGILVITTKRGDGARTNTFVPGIVTFTPKGYSMVREFFSPDYDKTKNERPDLRSTVYWNPHVVTSAEGKGSFSFFNADEKGTYRVVVEGIDASGHLARKVFTYELK